MARYRSPFYGDPNIAAIATNLTRAFVDSNPGQTAYYKEGARERRIKADELERQFNSRAAYAQRLKGVAGAFDPGEVYSLGALSGEDPRHTSHAVLGIKANSQAPDSEVARALVGTGKTIGENDGVSIPDREKVAQRADGARMARTATSASIAAQASRANNADTIKQRESEFARTGQSDVGKVFRDRDLPNLTEDDRKLLDERAQRAARGQDRPVLTSPGQVAFDPRTRVEIFRHPDQKPETTKLPTPSTVKGAIYEKMMRGETISPGEQAVLDTEKPPKPPLTVTEKQIGDMEFEALREIGAEDKTNFYNPAFRQEYGAKIEDARRAMVDAFQATRDPTRARQAYLRTLGIEPNMTFDKGSDGFLGYGARAPSLKPRTPKPGGAGEAIRGGPSSAPAPLSPRATPSAPPAAIGPPPANPAERRAGQTYQTGKGPMTWTGTGWVPAQ